LCFVSLALLDVDNDVLGELDYGLVAMTSLDHEIVWFRVRREYVRCIGYTLACRKGRR
jgi:hypothetical protein